MGLGHWSCCFHGRIMVRGFHSGSRYDLCHCKGCHGYHERQQRVSSLAVNTYLIVKKKAHLNRSYTELGCAFFLKFYFFWAAIIQTRAQARTTGMIPMQTKRTRLPLQGLSPMAADSGIKTDRTIPAFFTFDRGGGFCLLVLTGAGLNILGRIRMPEISRINTRISLTPVKVFSFALRV